MPDIQLYRDRSVPLLRIHHDCMYVRLQHEKKIIMRFYFALFEKLLSLAECHMSLKEFHMPPRYWELPLTERQVSHGGEAATTSRVSYTTAWKAPAFGRVSYATNGKAGICFPLTSYYYSGSVDSSSSQ